MSSWTDLGALLSELVATLSGAPTQATRLLRLHTPLGPDVLLAERMVVHEAIGPVEGDEAPAGFAMTVDCLCVDTHLALKALIGQPVLLELLTADSLSSLRPFHGHVTTAELLGSDGGLARYRLTVAPWLAFLAHRQDSWVFQGQTVPEIIEEVFADYQGQGTLAPAWRWDLADTSVYPQRSLCVQYQETDLAFVQRLLREEGLFAWWEHHGDSGSDSLGSHTLVIADHNGAFGPNTQQAVRYTQSSQVLPADSISRWRRVAQVHTAQVQLASEDYRSLSARPVSQSAAGAAPVPELSLCDVPGQYAYEDSTQGARLALCQMQALDAARSQARATASLRHAAPGSHWLLSDHPVHTGVDEARDRFVTLAVQHRARNNLRADLKARLDSLALTFQREQADAPPASPNASDEPLYQCQISAQPLAVPVRPAALDARGLPDPRLHTRPRITGVQTAVVVGEGEPVHTDRDHRVKLQFHWQRGSNASHRLGHPAGCNAPANDASGTWVRVATSQAGANWGGHFIPRVGQEVLVSFLNGDIDRPVVIGSLYNGQGSADAQGNQVGGGAAGASGNANAWFPGQQAQGPLQGHQHTQVHTGYKSQELASSAHGTGGHNQLVLDDSPGAGRVELSSTSAATRLQLGHLLHQQDNQRLQPRGHGLDLASQGWGALRAGAGLLLSAHAHSASTGSGQQLDSRDPQQQLQAGQQMLHALAETAQAHHAKLATEPAVQGATASQTAQQLPVEQAHYALLDSLAATQSQGAAEEAPTADGSAIGGGQGSISAWARPELLLAAPGGIGSFTPASHVATSGGSTGLVAGQDIAHLAQAHHASAAKDGLVLFTYGKAANPNKPNTETGIRLHAASGSVSSQSQTGATQVAADQNVDVASTTANLLVAAPQHVLLTAGGAAIRIEGGAITLSGPGNVSFKAGMKVLTGGGSARAPALQMPNTEFDIQFQLVSAAGRSMAGQLVRLMHEDGSLQTVKLDAGGRIPRQDTGREMRSVHVALAGNEQWRLLDSEHDPAFGESCDCVALPLEPQGPADLEQYFEFIDAKTGASIDDMTYKLLANNEVLADGETLVMGRTMAFSMDQLPEEIELIAWSNTYSTRG